MATYHMPPDTREKEKIIGGLFTWNQAGWIFGAFVLTLIVLFFLYTTTGVLWLSVLIGLLVGSTLMPFVFVKRQDLTLFQYIVRKRKFNKKTKHLINRKVIQKKVSVGLQEGI